ncbi:MAG: penicillin-insensitive murein endopeptidase [Rhizobiaceae bacterium]|nr:penicillin-insensitive murein endopeptidase [Rhizobiaceae bacterium]
MTWIAAGLAALLGIAGLAEGVARAAEPLAKTLFGAQRLPAAAAPKSYGFYSKGCFAGGVAIGVDGPNWQAMRLSRNRRWGHPAMIATLEKLSREAAADGWPGLLIGDISQPRGGPMLTGHASHQIGLDADIWFTPMPDHRLSESEREKLGAESMLKGDSLYVDDRKWTPAHAAVLKRAASYKEVERILVHPGIKKKLCDTVQGDRTWLRKVRPFWGHDAHFHVRIGCQPGSVGCKAQDAVPKGDGCDKSLAWWFTEEPWRPATGPAQPRARDIMTMASLPRECRAVLDAAAPASETAVTVHGRAAQAAVAPVTAAASAGAAQAGRTVGEVISELGYAPLPERGVPLPKPRPDR